MFSIRTLLNTLTLTLMLVLCCMYAPAARASSIVDSMMESVQSSWKNVSGKVNAATSDVNAAVQNAINKTTSNSPDAAKAREEALQKVKDLQSRSTDKAIYDPMIQALEKANMALDGEGNAGLDSFNSSAGSSSSGSPSLSNLSRKIANVVPNLMQLVTAIAYVLGMYMVIRAVIELKHFGEARTMHSTDRSLMKPGLFFVVGAALLYLPTTVHTGMSTFWSNPTPYAYISTGKDQWCTVVQDLFMVVQLIGTIALIKGLIMMTHLGGSHGGQPGTFAKALTHMIAGILCIDMYNFTSTIATTLSISMGGCFSS